VKVSHDQRRARSPSRRSAMRSRTDGFVFVNRPDAGQPRRTPGVLPDGIVEQTKGRDEESQGSC